MSELHNQMSYVAAPTPAAQKHPTRSEQSFVSRQASCLDLFQGPIRDTKNISFSDNPQVLTDCVLLTWAGFGCCLFCDFWYRLGCQNWLPYPTPEMPPPLFLKYLQALILGTPFGSQSGTQHLTKKRPHCEPKTGDLDSLLVMFKIV